MSSELLDQLQAGLGSAYTVDREIGRGGMATVFLAHDHKHDRSVALKVLHEPLAASLGPARFRREITLAARLQHPHILAVHDSGEAQGLLWFTMPYVDGETLRSRLNRQKQLPVEIAVQIAREVADALEYAHQHGVIHRDIKPENILLSSGHALVADFGIARAVTPGDGDHALTEVGMAIGTPRYMSPEQAHAERSIDGRTDVYSLAAVLYEMLAGVPPTGLWTGTVSVRKDRPSVPEAVDLALKKALQPMPADRFASAGEFAEALSAGMTPPRRRPYVAWVAVGIAVAALTLLVARWPARSGASKVLAVLPFNSLGASTQEYFAEGLTDELRGKLSSIAGLSVIATGSSEQYRHTEKTLQQIAHELGVRYLLVGTVSWDGASHVRVSPELVEVTSAPAPTTTWKQAFEANPSDVFSVQADIAGQVASELGLALGTSAKRKMTARLTENIAAHDAYLQGLALLPRTITAGTATPSAEVARQAAAAFRQAVALDSSFAAAWARLSLVDSRLYLADASPSVLAESRTAAERSLRLSPALPEGHQALGAYYANGPSDFARALSEDSIGLAAAPENVELLTAAGVNEINMGRLDAAIERLRHALALDPRSVLTATRLADALNRQGDFAGAREAAEHGLGVDPTSLALLESKAYAQRGQGDLGGARATLERALEVAPTNFEIIELDAMTYLMGGDLQGARHVLHQASARVDSAALFAYVATTYDLYWVLDDAEQRTLLGLGPGESSRRDWALALAHTYWSRGRADAAKAYADTALAAAQGTGAQDIALLGVAEAYDGHREDAIRHGHQAVTADPIATDRQNGPYTEMLLARIFMLAGQPDSAAAALAVAEKVPGFYLTPAWLTIDPTWAHVFRK
ncbi:MAG TPA: protein kinase [Gemmatimonadaceae bacterium]|nr:protein kinase [Gemmatimonadaceae bacterium]